MDTSRGMEAARPGVCSLLLGVCGLLPQLDPLAPSRSGGGPVGLGKLSLKLGEGLPIAAIVVLPHHLPAAAFKTENGQMLGRSAGVLVS